MNVPKGKLIPIGGNEAKGPAEQTDDDRSPLVDFFHSGILKEVLDEIRGEQSRIEVIPSASSVPDEMREMYDEAFEHLNLRQVGYLDIRSRGEAHAAENLKRLEQADGVIFTGGDQVKLTEILAGTPFFDLLKRRYQEEPFVIAGTSAGAMAMSHFMIREGNSAEPLLKGMVDTGQGFGLLPQAIIDTHFMNRGRLARMTEALMRHPECIALGISEDTGLVITGEDTMRAIGSGVIIVIEADEIIKTNYHHANEFEPVYIENLRLHILAQGASYSLRQRRFIEH
ncbi:cyanophycinase [Tellurirhabdus rosea]|uniref:cyanophycinase n=1 Tax=Tellurirhabdus rosea TaxID=2674997 RepID=UPI002255906E|nr:cyanophycinase [Tellurirhabdus rosea]